MPVIKNLTMSIPENGFTAVVGPSGCGKSTLTKLISGLLQPDEGEVYLSGEKIVTPRPTVEWLFKPCFVRVEKYFKKCYIAHKLFQIH